MTKCEVMKMAALQLDRSNFVFVNLLVYLQLGTFKNAHTTIRSN